MNWADVQTALVDVTRLALDDASYDVGWADREARWRAASHVRLSVLSNAPNGQDERRYTDEAGDLRERVYGNRRLVISFRCETTDQDLESSALAAADNIAAGLRQSDVEALLDAAGIGLARIENPRVISAPDGKGAIRSVVVLDVRFNAHISKTGPLVTRVESVAGTGTVDGLTVEIDVP